jgi:hypothetical protein
MVFFCVRLNALLIEARPRYPALATTSNARREVPINNCIFRTIVKVFMETPGKIGNRETLASIGLSQRILESDVCD